MALTELTLSQKKTDPSDRSVAPVRSPRRDTNRPSNRPSSTPSGIASVGRGSLRTFYADQRRQPNDESRFDLICLIRGADDWCLADERLRLGPGDLLLTTKGQHISFVTPTAPPGEICWLSFCLNPPQSWACGELEDTLEHHKSCVVEIPNGILSLFDRLILESKGTDEFGEYAAEAVFRAIMIDTLRAYRNARRDAERPAPILSEAIALAIKIMQDRIGSPLPIAELAAIVGLNTHQFHYLFLRETGYTPADYWARRRVERAKRLLETTKLSIIEIANSLGFPSAQYFATFFRRYSGGSPRDHRRRFRLTNAKVEE